MKNIFTTNIFVFVLFPVLIFTGCNATQLPTAEPNISQEKSGLFSPDETHYYSDSVNIGSHNLGELGFSFFRLNYTKTNTSKFWYVSTFNLSKELIIDPTFMFVVNSTTYTFRPELYTSRAIGRFYKGYIDEASQFILSRYVIQSLRTGDTVVVRLTGQNFFQEKTLAQLDIDNLKMFINQIDALPKIDYPPSKFLE